MSDIFKRAYSKNWCQGFCSGCGTSCADYCEDVHTFKSERDFLLEANEAASKDAKWFEEDRDRLRQALDHAKKVISKHSACGLKHIEEIEKIEKGEV